MIVIKLIALFVGMLFTIVNIYRVMIKNHIYAINVILQTLGIFVFVVIQFRLYE